MRKTTVEARRERVTKTCTTLPEAQASSRTGQHTRYDVRGRTFAYYVVDEHGDGRIALLVKVAPSVQATLVAAQSDRYFVPKYIGPRGWVGFDLAARKIDWGEITELLEESYRLIAPKKLAALVTASRGRS